MIDIKNYITQTVGLANSEIDTRKGSSIYDFLIDPLTSVFGPYHADHTTILNTLAVSDVSSLTDAQMDALATRFLTTRLTGTKAQGSLYLYFTEPRALTIKAGTQFISSTNLVVETLYDFVITGSAMGDDVSEYPNYKAGPIKVAATATGDSYNFPAGTSFTPVTKLTSTPSTIICKDAFTSGSNTETNLALFNRLKLEVHGNTLSSPVAIRNIITSTIPEIIDVDIVGAGNANMLRDEVKSLIDVERFVKEDYMYVYSGQHTGLHDKKHIAYVGVFNDVNQTASVDFPDLALWNTEFSDDMYYSIYALNDFEYVEVDRQVLIYDDFSQYNVPNNLAALSVIMLSGMWIASDSYTDLNVKEISLSNGKLQLGATTVAPEIAPIGDPRTPTSTIPTVTADTVYKVLKRVVAGEAVIEEVENAANEIYAAYSSPKYNWSPVFHKAITQNTGLEMNARMSTTDGTETGQICYITTRRNNAQAIAHDGYGMAWRKQPDYLIRMRYDNYDSTDLRNADIARFNAENPGVNGVNFMGDAMLSLAAKKYWKFNVFLVDNDALSESAWISREQIFDQTSGINQFVQAAKVWIEPNIDYNFRLKIFDGYGTLGWVWPASDVLDLNAHKVISRGQTYPTYTPIEETSIINGNISNDSTRNHFGIGVESTQNYIWYLSSIEVHSILEQFPMLLFKIHTGNFLPITDLTYKIYGVGYDANLAEYNPNNYPYSKMQVGAYNVTNSRWDIISGNTATIPTDLSLQLSDICVSGLLLSTSEYVDTDGYINFAVCAANSGENFPYNTDHTIRVYYVSLDNGVTSSMHRGNCSDVYVYDPINISTVSKTYTIDENSSIHILGSDVGYIQEIFDIQDSNFGISYDATDYMIVNNNPGVTYSAGNDYTIIFKDTSLWGANVNVIFKQWSKGDIISDLITNSEDRYPNADYMVKTMPPAVVKINTLEYAGGLAVQDMRNAIATYINTEAITGFDKSDIINLLYNNGATYVNLNMDIEIRYYSTTGVRTVLPMTGQTYTISTDSIMRLYTESKELIGVTKV